MAETAFDMIKRHEGERKNSEGRHIPYRCPANKLTIGWGRNIEERGISNAEAVMLADNDGESHDDVPNIHGVSRFFPVKKGGEWLIGYGRNLSRDGISDAEAETLLQNDIADSHAELAAAFIWFDDLDEVRQLALVDMHFNMGLRSLSRFRHMIAALAAGDYGTAADEAMDSAWFRQVGSRAVEVVAMIRNGQ